MKFGANTSLLYWLKIYKCSIPYPWFRTVHTVPQFILLEIKVIIYRNIVLLIDSPCWPLVAVLSYFLIIKSRNIIKVNHGELILIKFKIFLWTIRLKLISDNLTFLSCYFCLFNNLIISLLKLRLCMIAFDDFILF